MGQVRGAQANSIELFGLQFEGMILGWSDECLEKPAIPVSIAEVGQNMGLDNCALPCGASPPPPPVNDLRGSCGAAHIAEGSYDVCGNFIPKDATPTPKPCWSA